MIVARAQVKAAAKWVLSRRVVCRAGRWLQNRKCLVLAYHNVVPDGESWCGERSLHLEEARFAEQLDMLGDMFDVVPLSALWQTDVESTRGRVALTFDDAYAGTLTAGLTQLARRSLPATIFVPPGLIGTDAFWWDAFAQAGELPPGFRAEVLTSGARPADVQRCARAYGLKPRPVSASAQPGTTAALRTALRQPGITLGSHTWFHVALPALDEAEAAVEMTKPKSWLETEFGTAIGWISYPFALSSPDTELRAAAAGYEGAFLGRGGWARPQTLRDRPYAVPRLNIDSRTSPDAFRRLVAGFGGQ